MFSTIQLIEDLSLNAWPSHQMQLYDGWILRFSHFYTHRTNCIEQIGISTIPWERKIPYCEEVYRYWNTPAIFKITPLVNSLFDEELACRDYEIQHRTNVMTRKLSSYINAPGISEDNKPLIHLEHCITSTWIDGLFHLKHTTNPIHRRIVPSMYAAIPKEVIQASITMDGRIVATGLGILDRKHIGLYAIHVDDAYRGKHWAGAICSAILNEGKKKGAEDAYLQVVDGNTSALHVYESLGFKFLYSYWFRVQTQL